MKNLWQKQFQLDVTAAAAEEDEEKIFMVKILLN